MMKRAVDTAILSGDEKWMRFEDAIGRNCFDALSDDLIISVLSKISASAKSPSDLQDSCQDQVLLLGERCTWGRSLATCCTASHPEALYSHAIIQFQGSSSISGTHYQNDYDNLAESCAKLYILSHADASIQILCAIEDEDKIELDEDLSRQTHPANLFLLEWWRLSDLKGKRESESDGLQLCSRLCGRRETRSNEFNRCRCNKEFN